ncbi:DUF6364 family protein [Yimella sp. RIT 621]|uniref:DUF6364 family protein n=1 Tax=Yimella sp. RIT 621 TaxID=2510323 RepID=UPI001F113B16|nr:DUF6364 family protein [Yimella sp. RIT 621]
MTTRLNVNINDETAAALKELAKKNQTSVTEIVRRATGLYKFVADELGEGSKTLQVVDDKSNERTTLHVL